MTLYVRSQDKTVLSKVEALQCVSLAHSKHAIVTMGIELGRYETKERCLEILDEIQKLILKSNKFILTTDVYVDEEEFGQWLTDLEAAGANYICGDKNAKVFPLSETVVYQMPEK